MKLPNTVAYAVRATCYLAQTAPELPIPCSELAREGRMPERFLLQVLRTLVNHEILESTFGVSGGYVLSRSPEKTTLRDIIDAFDNALEIQLPTLECVTPSIQTQLNEVLARVFQAARKELHKVTIAELVATLPRDHYSLRIRQGRIAVPNLAPVEFDSYDAQGGKAVTR
jgi:Rrf2 family protein